MFLQMTARALLLSACALLASLAHARGPDDDPEAGESWVTRLVRVEAREGYVAAGQIRATDDFGATHDRDFRMLVSGSVERGDRRVVLHRYEPFCFDLAREAQLSVDDFCDRIALEYRENEVAIAFSSLDAHRRYRFTLRPDARVPGRWQSVPGELPQPALTLDSDADNTGVRYRWAMETFDAGYRQAGEIDAEQLRVFDLNAFEASLLALGEVLLTFNRYEFQYADLPREHPAHMESPYSLWAEEATEGGCIGLVCFGNIGNLGPGAASSPCNPASPQYNPASCVPDLTYARWPLSQRPKIQKVSNEEVRTMHFIVNKGHGQFDATNGQDADVISFVSLIRLGTSFPLVDHSDAGGWPLNGDCHRYDETFYHPDLFVLDLQLLPDARMTHGLRPIECPVHVRPDGRYRLYIHIDPTGTLDTPGYTANNIGNSSYFDWVHLR